MSEAEIPRIEDHLSSAQAEPRPARQAYEEGWSARRAKHNANEKRLMADYFPMHDFLVKPGSNPERDAREQVASVLVNQGTTPNLVVEEVLAWIKDNASEGPFTITWYTPGALVPATLRKFREENPQWRSATKLFLFPGKVDTDFESVVGKEPVEFAETLQNVGFKYAILSAYSFDITSGTASFFDESELELQRACALLYAAHKFLFVDPSKFNREGKSAYLASELLNTAEDFTIYTTSVDDEHDTWVKQKFDDLCRQLVIPSEELPQGEPRPHARDMKTLGLRIVGNGNRQSQSYSVQGLPRAEPQQD
jgi:hypothetical protein